MEKKSPKNWGHLGYGINRSMIMRNASISGMAGGGGRGHGEWEGIRKSYVLLQDFKRIRELLPLNKKATTM